MEGATQARERQAEARLAKTPQKPSRFSTAPSRTPSKKPKRSRLLQTTPRPSRGSTETPKRSRSAAKQAKHRYPPHTVKNRAAQKKRKKTRHARSPSRAHAKHEVRFVPACQESSKSGGSMSARRAWERDGHARSISSALRSSDSCSTSDATTASWVVKNIRDTCGFVTVDLSCTE